jgi:hypothetical protein
MTNEELEAYIDRLNVGLVRHISKSNEQIEALNEQIEQLKVSKQNLPDYE